ncbi:MAG: radical protein [Paenibacillaceae bacterium]|nr:radical protein [Paenibacillaceae bacterium]
MKPFQKIYIEITSICNLSCSFCPPTVRKAAFMDPDAFRDILGQVRPFTDQICLHVKGEPLLHPSIGTLLDICAEEELKVNLTTNGTLLPKKGAEILGKAGLRQVNISLHSMGEHRQKGQEYQLDYLRQCLRFAQEAAGHGTYVSLRLWDAPRMEEAGGLELNRRLAQIMEDTFALPPSALEASLPGKGIRVADRIYLNRDYRFEWPSLDAPEDEGRGFCHALRTHAAVLCDGMVVPCCLDGEGVIALGNLREQPFAEILQGDRARRLHDGFSGRRAVEELCRKCGYRKKFGSV